MSVTPAFAKTQGTQQSSWERAALPALLAVPALCGGLIAWLTGFSSPQGYLADAFSLVNEGRIEQDFTPAGYAEFVALGIRLTPHHPHLGIVLVQILLHITLTLAMFGILRCFGVTRLPATATALVLQLHPELLLSVNKVWDVAYSTELLLLVTLCGLLLMRRGATILLLAACGAAFGLALFQRPNFLPLALPLLWALWSAKVLSGSRNRSTHRRGSLVFLIGLPAAVSTVVFAVCSFTAFHRLDTPHNGPYNLYSGHNQLTVTTLLHKLNAEPSILPSLREKGIVLSEWDAHQDSTGPFFNRMAKTYIVAHPVQEIVVLPSVKLLTLLRPDTKVHNLHGPMGWIKALLTLPVFVWAVLLVRFRKTLDRSDIFLIALMLLYTLPFLVTNSDPRFRTPLDLLVLCHMAAMLFRQHALRIRFRSQQST